MAILSFLLATTPYYLSVDYWKFRSTCEALYQADVELSSRIIDSRENYLYEDQFLNLLLKTYLVYRIEVKNGNQNPDAVNQAFQKVDVFVECLKQD
jgi:hypothetical protein